MRRESLESKKHPLTRIAHYLGFVMSLSVIAIGIAVIGLGHVSGVFWGEWVGSGLTLIGFIHLLVVSILICMDRNQSRFVSVQGSDCYKKLPHWAGGY